MADRIRLLRDGGRRAGHVSVAPGVNSRLDEMQACYLSAFLPHLPEWNARRAHIAALYDEAIAGCASVRPVRRGPNSVNHLYVIRAKQRAKLQAFLQHRGIGSGIHYPVPLHLHPAFAQCGAKRGDFPHAERAAREVLSLPIWPYMSDGDAAFRVALEVKRFYTVLR